MVLMESVCEQGTMHRNPKVDIRLLFKKLLVTRSHMKYGCHHAHYYYHNPLFTCIVSPISHLFHRLLTKGFQFLFFLFHILHYLEYTQDKFSFPQIKRQNFPLLYDNMKTNSYATSPLNNGNYAYG